jgi:hypothetical protein
MANRYRTLGIGCLAVLIAPIVFFAGWLWIAPNSFWYFLTDTKLRQDYHKIAVGVPLPEVEALLGGPGKQLKEKELPETPCGPVVNGDQFYQWTGPLNGQKIIIGVRDGRVCAKWYWEYSL